ncbi:hypothetical protein EV368DRAFT_89547 [Lentinula lateritia]|nr:hypothetical protein EV368DRAFT_89547 [Lentinula lateritia]
MSASRTTTQTTSDIGSIPVTTGTGNQPPAPTRPPTPSVSDKERELKSQLVRNWERLQQLKEKRQAKEAARRKAEEEAAKRAAEEEKKKREAAARAIQARKLEEEAAEKRRWVVAAAARSRRGPSPGEATTSTRRVEVEIPRVVKKGKTPQRNEASGGDPDDGDDGGNCWDQS